MSVQKRTFYILLIILVCIGAWYILHTRTKKETPMYRANDTQSLDTLEASVSDIQIGNYSNTFK